MPQTVGQFSTRATTLFETSFQLKFCTQSYGSPKLWESLVGSPGTKCHLDVGLAERHRIYYKGGGGGFPQVWAVVSLVSPSLLVARPSTKVLKLCINQLFV